MGTVERARPEGPTADNRSNGLVPGSSETLFHNKRNGILEVKLEAGSSDDHVPIRASGVRDPSFIRSDVA